jgi:hypothetical protein
MCRFLFQLEDLLWLTGIEKFKFLLTSSTVGKSYTREQSARAKLKLQRVENNLVSRPQGEAALVESCTPPAPTCD